MFHKLICQNAKCGSEFVLQPDHKGYSTLCPNCNKGDVERVGAEVHWEGKHTPVVEIVPSLEKAKRFNNKGQRFGHSVIRRLTGVPFQGGYGIPKEEHENNPGSSYTTPLGEKHSTKR